MNEDTDKAFVDRVEKWRTNSHRENIDSIAVQLGLDLSQYRSYDILMDGIGLSIWELKNNFDEILIAVKLDLLDRVMDEVNQFDKYELDWQWMKVKAGGEYLLIDDVITKIKELKQELAK